MYSPTMSSLSPQSSPVPREGDGGGVKSGQEGLQSLDLFSEETVDKLAGGFLAVFEPELVRVERSLEELV